MALAFAPLAATLGEVPRNPLPQVGENRATGNCLVSTYGPAVPAADMRGRISVGTIGEVVACQLERSLQSLEEAINRCDERLWRCEDGGHGVWGVARQAYHAIESVDFYSRLSPAGFEFSRQLGANWEDDPVDGLPSREALLAYVSDVRTRAARHLAGVTSEAFLAADGFPGTGGTALDTVLYNIRHLQHHVGQINLMLRKGGLEPATWR